jgi:hypothetical protein
VGPRADLDEVVKRKIPSPRRESNPPYFNCLNREYPTPLCQLQTYQSTTQHDITSPMSLLVPSGKQGHYGVHRNWS